MPENILAHNILNAWPALLGWPAVVLSVLVAGVGVLRRRVPLLVTAAVLAVPFSLYLTGSPKFGPVGLAPVAAYLLASGAIQSNHVKLGATLAAVPAVFFLWLAWYLFA